MIALVSGINYTVPVKNNTQSYHIADRYTMTAKFTEYHLSGLLKTVRNRICVFHLKCMKAVPISLMLKKQQDF